MTDEERGFCRVRIEPMYRTYYNCDGGGHATRVRFSHRDRWIGPHYQRFNGFYVWTPFRRALRAMRRLELRKQTDRRIYAVAQRIATTLLVSPHR